MECTRAGWPRSFSPPFRKGEVEAECLIGFNAREECSCWFLERNGFPGFGDVVTSGCVTLRPKGGEKCGDWVSWVRVGVVTSFFC